MLGHDRRELAAIFVGGALGTVARAGRTGDARRARSPAAPPRRRLTATLANPARRPDRYALNQRRLADARVAAQQQTAVVAVRDEPLQPRLLIRSSSTHLIFSWPKTGTSNWPLTGGTSAEIDSCAATVQRNPVLRAP